MKHFKTFENAGEKLWTPIENDDDWHWSNDTIIPINRKVINYILGRLNAGWNLKYDRAMHWIELEPIGGSALNTILITSCDDEYFFCEFRITGSVFKCDGVEGLYQLLKNLKITTE